MLAELRVTPVGYRTEFSRLVAGCVKVIAESGLPYRVGAMGTTLEGELEDILQVVRRCHEEVRKHADRVLIELSIDDRVRAENELVRGLERIEKLGTGVALERMEKDASR